MELQASLKQKLQSRFPRNYAGSEAKFTVTHFVVTSPTRDYLNNKDKDVYRGYKTRRKEKKVRPLTPAVARF